VSTVFRGNESQARRTDIRATVPDFRVSVMVMTVPQAGDPAGRLAVHGAGHHG
jgi:hypothetical protein